MSLLLALTAGGGGGPINYSDSLSVGVYSIAGQVVADSLAVSDALSAGAYAYTGNDLNDTITGAIADNLSAGSYVYTGNDLNDVVTGATAYADDLQAGAYAITGYDLNDEVVPAITTVVTRGGIKPPKQVIKKREDVEAVVLAAYEKVMGIAPSPEIVEEVMQEAAQEVRKIAPVVDYQAEQAVAAMLVNIEMQIARIKAAQDAEDDDEEALMMLL